MQRKYQALTQKAHIFKTIKFKHLIGLEFKFQFSGTLAMDLCCRLASRRGGVESESVPPPCVSLILKKSKNIILIVASLGIYVFNNGWTCMIYFLIAYPPGFNDQTTLHS